MEIFKGSTIFSGIAIGRVLFYRREEYQVRQYMVANIRKELEDFHAACEQTLGQLRELYSSNSLLTEEAYKFSTQIKLMEKGSFQRAVESMMVNEKVNAAYAVATTRDELAATFRNLEEPFIKERIENIKEIAGKIINHLGGISSKIDLGDTPIVLVADSLTPSEMVEMDKEKLLAIVTKKGSNVSHASIVAKTMGIPTIADVDISEEWDGKNVIVDSYIGTVYLSPDGELLREYIIRCQAEQDEKEELLKLKDQEDITLDGTKVNLCGNVGNLDDLNSTLFYGASGIGLMRSEFQYLGRENYPRENELYRAYKRAAEIMGKRPIVIRTVDIGAEKQAEYMGIPQEINPIMGNRGIRLCLDRKRMFKAQLRAIYRASAYGNLAIMYPMITSEKELDEIAEIVDEVKRGLQEKEIPYKDIQTGVLIETPASVMMAGELARKVDFLSIGTNDLTQYTLAMDRQNPYLKDKYDDHHPAVLKMIEMVIEAGHKEGKKVGICGELAADTKLTSRFLKLGVDELSVVPACLLPVRKAIRETDLSDLSQ